MASLDLWRLGCWERLVNLQWEGQPLPVLLRVVGDRTPALEAGCARMEEELAQWVPGSVRRRALQALLEAMPPGELLEEALAAELPALERAAERTLPDLPLRRDLEAGETPAQFAARRASWQEQGQTRQVQREQLVAQMAAERREGLAAQSAAELAARVVPERVQQAAGEAFAAGVTEGLLAMACRQPEPPHQALFDGPDQVRGLPAALRQALAEGYQALDAGLGGDLPKG